MAEQINETATEEISSRFIVGIDLGTTNSALSYVDTQRSNWTVETFPVPQLVSPGQIEKRESLPSFLYQRAEGEFQAGALDLPWDTKNPTQCVGIMARDHGCLVPGRMVASAKSWLCHSGVDRTSKLLPWHGAGDVTKLTPVEVNARYLQHFQSAWDHHFPDHPLAEQEIVLTLPASFDEIARELTIDAARKAGLPKVVLIEEPQAAFYCWIDRHRDDWSTLVEAGQNILVCDVGGGTTDFTMIRVKLSESESSGIAFHRISVGDHLILGGDNLDLALAKSLESDVSATSKLAPRQWDYLLGQCRTVKELMLGDHPPAQTTVHLPGEGSRLLGGSTQIEVTRDRVTTLLLDGFFPYTEIADRPGREASGFQEFGLPYASDPAVTKYLGEFLVRTGQTLISEGSSDHDIERDAVQAARPDIVLFNGGVFSSPQIQKRLMDVLQEWYGEPDAARYEPTVLENPRLDLAVSRGAAYYGMARRGSGIKITAGLSRTYYVGVDANPPAALCLIPSGTEPGHDVELQGREFKLRVGHPIEFPLYTSATRLNDVAGDLIEVDREQMTSLAPIRTVIKLGKQRDKGQVDVTLHCQLSEIGTMELWCRESHGEQSWRLQFDVRSAVETDVAAHTGEGEAAGFVDESSWEVCRGLLHETFAKSGKASPDGLMKRLAHGLELPKQDWPPSLLRRIWESLIDCEQGRRKSASHEARWLNLLGYSLRPGYGIALDDWRVSETWKLLQGKLIHGALACRAESWILWRRIAGGLSPGQQESLASPLLNSVRQLHRQMMTGRGKGAQFDFGSHEAAEIWRLLGSLERLDLRLKIELGGMLVDILPKKKIQPTRLGVIWALGRLGARVPIYGLLNHVVPPDVVGGWVERMLTLPSDEPTEQLALMQMARRSDDRYLDLDESLRDHVIDRLRTNGAPAHLIQLVAEGGDLDEGEQKQVFGESLPIGLQIH